MAKYAISYAVLKDEDVVFESEIEVSFTKKDIAELEEFVKEHNYSAEIVDIPAHMFDKFMGKAIDAACGEFPDYAKADSGMEVALDNYIPDSLIDVLSEETQQKVLANIPEELFEDEEEDDNEEPEEEIVPTKENTLYLTIKQSFFDQIVAGTKKEEFREIKETTFKKYLHCDENGWPYIFTEKATPETPHIGDICIWNNGDYPYEPKDLYFLNLAVGYNKERDTALVEIEDITFEPLKTREGKDARFKEEGQHLIFCDDGDFCLWNIVYHLGKVVELHRKGE